MAPFPQWQQINAPDFSQSSQLMDNSSKLFTDAFQGMSDLAKGQRDARAEFKERNDQHQLDMAKSAILAQVQSGKDLGKLDLNALVNSVPSTKTGDLLTFFNTSFNTQASQRVESIKATAEAQEKSAQARKEAVEAQVSLFNLTNLANDQQRYQQAANTLSTLVAGGADDQTIQNVALQFGSTMSNDSKLKDYTKQILENRNALATSGPAAQAIQTQKTYGFNNIDRLYNTDTNNNYVDILTNQTKSYEQTSLFRPEANDVKVLEQQVGQYAQDKVYSLKGPDKDDIAVKRLTNSVLRQVYDSSGNLDIQNNVIESLSDTFQNLDPDIRDQVLQDTRVTPAMSLLAMQQTATDSGIIANMTSYFSEGLDTDEYRAHLKKILREEVLNRVNYYENSNKLREANINKEHIEQVKEKYSNVVSKIAMGIKLSRPEGMFLDSINKSQGSGVTDQILSNWNQLEQPYLDDKGNPFPPKVPASLSKNESVDTQLDSKDFASIIQKTKAINKENASIRKPDVDPLSVRAHLEKQKKEENPLTQSKSKKIIKTFGSI